MKGVEFEEGDLFVFILSAMQWNIKPSDWEMPTQNAALEADSNSHQISIYLTLSLEFLGPRGVFLIFSLILHLFPFPPLLLPLLPT